MILRLPQAEARAVLGVVPLTLQELREAYGIRPLDPALTA